jgi:phosphatidylglycerophosphate synthase
MSSPEDLALKGEAVEEWIDLRFFRPVGIRIARALQPSSISANQVTLWSLVVGLLAAHLFVYTSPWINALGFVLVVVADLLDSADGQLARLRGTASRRGRILDGYADNLRWTFVYVHITLRLLLEGWGWPAVALAVIAGGGHSLHSAIVDFIQGAYLEIAAGKKGQIDLPEDLPEAQRGASAGAPLWWRFGVAFYIGFARRQAWLFPRTVALLRRSRAAGLDPELRARYAVRQRPLLFGCPWIGQNAHIGVLGIAAISGRPSFFLWATAILMTLIGGILVLLHERAVRRLAA